MLSLEACREILGADAPEDDQELAERREEAYRLARLLVEVFQGTTKRPPLDPFSDPKK
jgi:hypothetical protein